MHVRKVREFLALLSPRACLSLAVMGDSDGAFPVTASSLSGGTDYGEIDSLMIIYLSPCSKPHLLSDQSRSVYFW